MFLLLHTVLLLSLVTLSTPLPIYIAEIPNGNALPDPCSPPNLPATNGSGHCNLGGGGANNQFGLDFAAAGHTWTAALCKMDSDKDGRSNGLEVGDPDCTWTKANPTPLKKAIGQPGICEPLTAPNCASQPFQCPTAKKPKYFFNHNSH